MIERETIVYVFLPKEDPPPTPPPRHPRPYVHEKGILLLTFLCVGLLIVIAVGLTMNPPRVPSPANPPPRLEQPSNQMPPNPPVGASR